MAKLTRPQTVGLALFNILLSPLAALREVFTGIRTFRNTQSIGGGKRVVGASLFLVKGMGLLGAVAGVVLAGYEIWSGHWISNVGVAAGPAGIAAAFFLTLALALAGRLLGAAFGAALASPVAVSALQSSGQQLTTGQFLGAAGRLMRNATLAAAVGQEVFNDSLKDHLSPVMNPNVVGRRSADVEMGTIGGDRTRSASVSTHASAPPSDSRSESHPSSSLETSTSHSPVEGSALAGGPPAGKNPHRLHDDPLHDDEFTANFEDGESAVQSKLKTEEGELHALEEQVEVTVKKTQAVMQELEHATGKKSHISDSLADNPLFAKRVAAANPGKEGLGGLSDQQRTTLEDTVKKVQEGGEGMHRGE